MTQPFSCVLRLCCAAAPSPLPIETTLTVFGDEKASYGASADACVPVTALWVHYPTPDAKIEGSGAQAKLSILLKDHLGSARVVTDANGTVIQASTYAPYGAQTPTLQSPDASEDHAYIGERQDETGLLYLNARYYDPALGRFLSPDWWDPQQASHRMLYFSEIPLVLPGGFPTEAPARAGCANRVNIIDKRGSRFLVIFFP